jgi:hypothetical protein
MINRLIFACTLIVSTLSLLAQEKKKWNVNNPDGPFKEVSFNVNEGTWMNLDVSPDGLKVSHNSIKF